MKFTSISSGLRFLYWADSSFECCERDIPLELVSTDNTVKAVEGSRLGGSSNAIFRRSLFFLPASFFSLAAFCLSVRPFRFRFRSGLGLDFDLVFRAGFLRVAVFFEGAFFGTPAAASPRATAGFRLDAEARPVWAFGFPGFVA